MKRTNYYYPQQMLDRLKAASAATGVPMAELIRTAVETYLKKLGW